MSRLSLVAVTIAMFSACTWQKSSDSCEEDAPSILAVTPERQAWVRQFVGATPEQSNTECAESAEVAQTYTQPVCACHTPSR